MAQPQKRKNSVRQSVTLPAALAADVRRVARARGVTVSRALVALAERGVAAERENRRQLRAAYDQFMSESEPARKDEAGRNLMRAVFGRDAVGEDPI